MLNLSHVELPSAKRVPISFGIILLPNFTLTSLSGFIDLLKMVKEERDKSRPSPCTWSIIGDTLLPVSSSNGVEVKPKELLGDPQRFDYIVVIGGVYDKHRLLRTNIRLFIQKAAQYQSISLVSICSATFALKKAGVLDHQRICLSWYHYADFLKEFPRHEPQDIVADRLFILNGRRITCSGGRAPIDLAAAILLKHIDIGLVQKALRVLQIEQDIKPLQSLHHKVDVTIEPNYQHPIIKRAAILMIQHLNRNLSTQELADMLDISERQLERLFKEQLAQTVQAFERNMKLENAVWRLHNTKHSIAQIAKACGYVDASHMGRIFKQYKKLSPSEFRKQTTSKADGGESYFVEIMHSQQNEILIKPDDDIVE